jgi:hypothetical protein
MSEQQNLLAETREALANYFRKPEEIIFIGSRRSGHECTWAEFERLADTGYDAGYGAQEVASDLEIAFSDGATMHRSEYDGSEAWVYAPTFERAVAGGPKPIQFLTVHQASAAGRRVSCGWESLADLNNA